MRGDALAALARHRRDRFDFVVGHQRLRGRRCRRRRVARGHDLQHVDAFAARFARGAAELDRSVARQRVHRVAGIEMQLAQIADSAGDGELHAGGEEPRPWKLAARDRVARDDVEPGLRRRRAEAAGEALFEIKLRVRERREQMLFHRQLMECVRRRLVDEAQVRMRLDEPGHQRRAIAVDDLRARRWRDRFADARNPVSVDLHARAKGRGAGAVEHRRVAKQRSHCPVHPIDCVLEAGILRATSSGSTPTLTRREPPATPAARAASRVR